MKVLAVLCMLAAMVAGTNAGALYTRTRVPQDWEMLGAAPRSAPVKFTIALKPQNSDLLNEMFVDRTDPESDNYLEWLTKEEMDAKFGATKADRNAVSSWLTRSGITQITHGHTSIEVKTDAATASRLFNTEMRTFQHKKSGKKIAKAWGTFSVPDAVHEKLQFVSGISSFPVERPSLHKPLAPPANEAVIPQTCVAKYGIRTQNPGSVTAATQGVIEYEDQFFDNTNLGDFATSIGYTGGNTVIAPIPDSRVVGTNDPTQPGDESTLDIQYIASINMEVPSWFWIEDSENWVYEFGEHILGYTNPPQVTSTSYAWWEGDQCDIDSAGCQQLGVDSYGYANAVNTLFQKVGLMGVSLLFASGDSGANGRTNGDCSVPQLRPDFPASSPYVTAVGGTEFQNATYFTSGPAICTNGTYSCISGGPEAAVSIAISGFASGGGFSNLSNSRPTWQASVVQTYLSSGVPLPPASYWNQPGRGYPDVAAVGHNGLIYLDSLFPIGGTSMSTPIFSGIVSLLNTISVTKTGKSLGFLNPLLYQMAAADPTTFIDVTIGDNICTEDGCSPGCQGFYATKGWDPVTGLGVPQAAAMEAYVSKLADKVLARRAAKAAQIA